MGRLNSSIYRQGGEAADDVTNRLETRQRGPSEMFNKRWDNPDTDLSLPASRTNPRTLTRDQLPAEQRGQWTNIRDGFARVLGISTSKSARQQTDEITEANEVKRQSLSIRRHTIKANLLTFSLF